ncbi:hypothetical protein G7Y89_g4350 [Cudoniella acicularis]|uniref:Uncharacterized protein n=1 Tax=Cudoniella acicularis TaxID=354080 RepID=A0A8H4W7J1_9HELO|nr:hypothetical protein G7Y89_g4350 [Cudoniella acicularis]
MGPGAQHNSDASMLDTPEDIPLVEQRLQHHDVEMIISAGNGDVAAQDYIESDDESNTQTALLRAGNFSSPPDQCYIQSLRHSHITAYSQLRMRRDRLVNRLQNLELEHKGLHRGRFSVAYCCHLLEQIINALDRWIVDLEELIPTIAEECCQRRCFANLAKEYPWDSILVQELVEKRMKLYTEAVKKADGATGQQTEISIPEITQRDLVELINRCPSTDHQDWLFQNVGLRCFSPVYQRIRIGTFSNSRANSSDSNPGVREDLWIKIKPLDTPLGQVSYEAIQILAILPFQYVSLQQLKKDVQNHPLQGAESTMRQVTSLIARNQHCLCPREDDGSVSTHERGFHSLDKSNDDANLRGFKAILDRASPAVPGMSKSGRSIVRRDYNDDNYYANIGFAEEDEKSEGYNPLKHRCKETGNQSKFLLHLAAKGKLSIQDGGYDEDLTVENMQSLLLPGLKMSSRLMTYVLNALPALREDILFVNAG